MPQLSQIYFDIQPARGQGGNFMQEMLGSLMGGGAANKDSPTPTPIRRAAAPKIMKMESEPEAPEAISGTPAEELDLD
jgi:hypothetical protein